MARQSKVDATHNFLSLYLHHAGKSEIPTAYHKWACLSLLAALVRDNVWYEKYARIKLTPHLYVWLISASGTGKDIAARVAQNMLKHVNGIRLYQGRTSSAALIDYMYRIPKGASFADPRIWLLSTELANSIGSGGAADAFVKFTTDIYSGKDPDVPWQDMTRYSGVKQLTSPLINWFAGTTRTWLCQCVTMADIMGGFFARVCPVEVEVPVDLRIRQPTYPWDYQQTLDHLYQRVELYANAEGVFTMSPDADAIDRQWYDNRPAPHDDRLLPTWRRQHEIVLKLSQLYALCEWEDLAAPFIIDVPHLVAAQKDASYFLKMTTSLLDYAATTNVDAAAMLLVANYIKKHEAVRKSRLLKEVYRDGISAEMLHRICETLQQAGEITIHQPEGVQASTRNPTYLWQRRKMHLQEVPLPR